MPTFEISWGWDGTEEGSAQIEADDEDEARAEAWACYNEMMNERGYFKAAQTSE